MILIICSIYISISLLILAFWSGLLAATKKLDNKKYSVLDLILLSFALPSILIIGLIILPLYGVFILGSKVGKKYPPKN